MRVIASRRASRPTGAGTGEEPIGEGVACRAGTPFGARVAFAQAADHIKHLPPFAFGIEDTSAADRL